jgi:hypothetical protein
MKTNKNLEEEITKATIMYGIADSGYLCQELYSPHLAPAVLLPRFKQFILWIQISQ